MELDEIWSFVLRRKSKRWVWLAMCRRTRQIVAYAIGDRGRKTCRILRERIPEAYKTSLMFTDFWDAYQTVLPDEQHVITDKGDGETNHIERFNNVLRQRLARFVRRTLSFSKIDTMHDNCLRLFLHEYNLLIKNST
ncbi:IS1 transposase [Capsulimonas corticalis]|uniref:IS1 transposase n=1 Tax=Capsulimonas corticalis TaxID=2219043 RepID=A0A402D0Z5_9BACT|nr:IS1 transposase [Capsulimonas corticalis]